MSKKQRQISLVFIGFLLMLLTVISFAEAPEAPNQLITKNPFKEVKTVEANKNREHAEMKISVNKLNIKNLNGFKIDNNEIYIELPSNEVLKDNEIYYISKNVEELPDIYNANGKKIITNLNKFEKHNIQTLEFNYGIFENIILVDKIPAGINELIISKLDKSTGEIKKIYKVDKFNSIITPELEGESINKTQVVIHLPDNLLKDFTGNEKQIKIGKTLKDILKKEKRKKRDIDDNALKYEIDKEKKNLMIISDSDDSLEEVKIVVLNNDKVEKIYRGKRKINFTERNILEQEDISIPENQVNIPYQYIPGFLSYVIFDGERHNSNGREREHFAKGNIVLATYRENPTKIRIFRLGGYVSKNTIHTITVGTTSGYEKTYIVREFPQKNILEKPIEDYTLNTELINENNTHYIGNLKLEYYIENKIVNNWENYLGLKVNLGDTTYYRKLSLKRIKQVGQLPPNLYVELRTVGFENIPIGGYIGATKLVGALTGTYKMFLSRKSIGKLKIELDARVLEAAKKNLNLSKLVAGQYLTSNLTTWLNDGNIKKDYSEMINTTNNLNLTVPISNYITYIGRNILSKENGKQIFSNRYNNQKGLAIPTGNINKVKLLEGFSVNLNDFNKGEKEEAIFTYKGTDNKNYSGEIEILVGAQSKILGEGSIDLSKIQTNQINIFPTTNGGNISSDKGLRLENLSGNLPNTKSLKVNSILNNIHFKIKSKTINFEKIEGNVEGVQAQEVLLEDERLPFKIGLTKEGALKLEKLRNENFNYIIEMEYRYKEVTLGVFKLNLKNSIKINEGNIYIEYKEPIFQGGSGKTGLFDDSTYFGRIRIYPKTQVKMLTGRDKIEGNFISDRKEQYKVFSSNNTIIPLKKEFVDGKNEVVIVAKIDGKSTQPQKFLLKELQHGLIENVYLSTNAGAFQFLVNIPQIETSNGGFDLGIDRWDLKQHNIELELYYPQLKIKNKIFVKIPEFNSMAYFDNKSLLNSLIEGTKIRNKITNFEKGELFNLSLCTKDFDLEHMQTNYMEDTKTLGFKIPKVLKLYLEDKEGRKEEVIGKIILQTNNSNTKIIDKKHETDYYILSRNNDRKSSMKIDVGIRLELDLTKIKDKFRRAPFKLYSENASIVSIGNQYSQNTFKEIINKIEYIVDYTGESHSKIILSNPIVAGSYGAPFGRMRIFSNSSNFLPSIYFLDSNDEIIMTDIKNNQYKSGKILGTYIPAIPNNFGGNELSIIFNNGIGEKKVIKNLDLDHSENFNGNLTTEYYDNNGIEVGVDYQQSSRSYYGTDISLRNWDLKEKNIKIRMKHPRLENNFNIIIPEFDGEVYYNKNIIQDKPTEINYTNKTLYGRFIREHSGNMQIKVNIGTKDYDLRILGKYNGKTNLKLKIPKEVILTVRDDLGVEKQILFYTEIFKLSTGIKEETQNYYYLYAPNDGEKNNSEINATIILKTLFRGSDISWNQITGNNLNLVSISANSKNIEKNFTIIDNVDLKMELANFKEKIDVSNIDISQKKYSQNGYYGLIQNENKVVLKDGNREIFTTTFEELTKTKKEILEAGVSIKYNYGTVQDINRNQFEFEKIKGVNYNKTLRLEIQTSKGQLLYYIEFNILNKVSFEILPGKGVLDFGSFFPGDIKKAESLIEFRNPNNANINISLSSNNNNKMFKKGVPISRDTTILLSDLEVKDLKLGNNNTNNFKISGTATTTKNTASGEYLGELEVIITIIP